MGAVVGRPLFSSFKRLFAFREDDGASADTSLLARYSERVKFSNAAMSGSRGAPQSSTSAATAEQGSIALIAAYLRNTHRFVQVSVQCDSIITLLPLPRQPLRNV